MPGKPWLWAVSPGGSQASGNSWLKVATPLLTSGFPVGWEGSGLSWEHSMDT